MEVDQSHKVFEQPLYAVLRWWNEGRVDGAETTTADPILFVANHSCVAFLGGAFEQGPMDVDEVVDPEVAFGRSDFNGLLHRPNVCEYCCRRAIRCLRLIRSEGQSLVRGAEALDEGGTEGFSPE